MATKGPRPAGKLWRPSPNNTLIGRTGRFFRKLGFSVYHPMQNDPKYDLWVERRENGTTRRIALVCGRPDALVDQDLLELARTREAELWYVDDEVSDESRRAARALMFTRAVTLEELQNLEKIGEPDLARTAVGQAINRNHDTVVLNATALAVMLDERIEALRAALPNSESARQARDVELADLEEVRGRLAVLRTSVVRYRGRKVSEAALNDAAVSFWATVKKWYAKHHDKLLTQASDVSIFLISTGLASAIGVQPTIAASISAVLVGGKPIASALKSIAKSVLKKDE